MAQKSQRARKRQKRDLVLGTLILMVIAVFLIGGWYLYTNAPQGLDEVTLCPVTGPSGHYVLLVDKTDEMNFVQKESFTVTLHDLIERRLPEGYLLSVFILGESFQENAAPIIELCNPGSGEGKSELTSNIKQLRRQYDEKFLQRLLSKTDTFLSPQTANASPIFEMLQLVGINSFRKHGIEGERRLIIVSDMLHNTPQFSMYKNSMEFKSFSDTDYGRKTQLELTNIEVEIHYVMNTPKFQTVRNLKFWEDYFSKANARIVYVRPLEG